MVAARVQQVDGLPTGLPLVRLLELLSILHDGIETPVRTATPTHLPQIAEIVHMNRVFGLPQPHGQEKATNSTRHASWISNIPTSLTTIQGRTY